MFNNNGKALIAGPCALESKKQIFRIAEFVKKQGATAIRAGCWKGQNRPIIDNKPEFVGLGMRGISILCKIQNELDIPCICDIQSVSQLTFAYDAGIELLMIGARNMDNLCLLRSVRSFFDTRHSKRKIILKRGPSATVDEWIGAAEHLGGPQRVILCARGTVHFDRDNYTRYRLDFVGIAEIKRYFPEYKVIVDPSHGSGDRDLVYLLSKAALEIADGLMIEVHYKPDKSPTDAPQIIDFNEFKKIARLYNGQEN